MKKNPIVARAIEREDKVIGNLKRQFVRNSVFRQRQVGISPATANGNIALGYYRGIAVGEQDRTKAIIYLLKKKFPKAAEYIKNRYKK